MSNENTGQLTREELKNLKAGEIVEAKNAGRLNTLLGLPVPTDGPITDREQLRGMTAAEVVRAKSEGRLNDLLGLK